MIEVSAAPADVAPEGADTVVAGIVEGSPPPEELRGLMESGEAKAKAGHLALTHAGGRRWIAVGLGAGRTEDVRAAAAKVVGRAKELGTRHLAWLAPAGQEAAVVEGTLLAAYSYKPQEAQGLERLTVVGATGQRAVAEAAVVAHAVNWARDLQDTPANLLTPTALGERAAQIEHVELDVTVPPEGMGSFRAVALGSTQPPRLIVARYEGPDAQGPLLGLVGKAVTHDTGGLSIKPATSMVAMKYDMSGGAAVLGALKAIAALALPVRIVAVVGATENAIGPAAMKPGDVITALDGTTIEVNNTDAEGRLVLCDCLTHARALGAERLVDVATLTGGVVTALGTVFAGAFANDEAWAAGVLAAGEATGERLWRLPLDPAYAEQIKGRFADIVNATAERKAQPVTAAEFLHHFVGDVPWAHLDIAGVASDAGLPWAGKGGSGFGVRLLVQLARDLAAAPAVQPAL